MAIGDGEYSAFHEGVAVFTPDGREVVALRGTAGAVPGEDRDEVVTLDASTLTPIDRPPVPLGSTGRMIGVTPDGRQAIVVTSTYLQPVNETAIVVLDLATSRVVRTIRVEPAGEPIAGFRNNTVDESGEIIGLGANFGDVVIVDPTTGTVDPPIHAHDDFVESISFAPDHTTFVTTGRDGTLHLWDATTKRMLGSILRPNHRLRASFLTADQVLIVDDGGEVMQWDPRPDAWTNYACQVAARNFTQAEWADLFPGEPYRTTCPDFPPGQ